MKKILLIISFILIISCNFYKFKKFDKTRKISLLKFDNKDVDFNIQNLIRKKFKQELLNQYAVKIVEENQADEFILIKIIDSTASSISFESQDNLDGISDQFNDSFRTESHLQVLKVKFEILDREKKVIQYHNYQVQAFFSEWVDLGEEQKQALRLTILRLVKKMVKDL